MHNIVIGLVTRHVSGSNGVVAERDDLKSLQYYRFLPIAKKKGRLFVLQTLLTLCKVSFQRFHKLAMGLCFMYSSTLVRAVHLANKIREISGLYRGGYRRVQIHIVP